MPSSGHSHGLDARVIRAVVDAFYARVRRDRELGPVFDEAIGDDWDAHLDKITSFWLTVTRVGTGYQGRDFMPAHLRHTSVRAEQLPRWLELFRETCAERCEPEGAAALIEIAERMAENLAISLRRRDGEA